MWLETARSCLSPIVELYAHTSPFEAFFPLVMHYLKAAFWFVLALAGPGSGQESSPSATAGVEALVQRRLPDHVDAFEFSIRPHTDSPAPIPDEFTVTSTDDGKIRVEGTTTSALVSG